MYKENLSFCLEIYIIRKEEIRRGKQYIANNNKM